MCNYYDIIIPTVSRDINFLSWIVKYIRKNLSEARTIFIITKVENFKKLKGLENQYRCKPIDEDRLIEELSFSDVYSYLKGKKHEVKRTGWYFQQFLKMAFAKSDYCKDYYLSWDSDTLPLSHIAFFSGKQPLFTLKKEYHKPYFDTIECLLGLHKLKNESFIAEHMLFNGKIMRGLIDDIEIRYPPNRYWKSIINAISVNGEGNYFSEFETYGTYCEAHYPGFYGYQKLNTFRTAAMIQGRHINERFLDRLAIDLDIVSFEVQDERFPYNFEKILDKFKSLKTACFYDTNRQ